MILLEGRKLPGGLLISKKHKYVDFILQGEGEETFPKLMDAVTGTGQPSQFDGINGLLYRRDGKFM